MQGLIFFRLSFTINRVPSQMQLNIDHPELTEGLAR